MPTSPDTANYHIGKGVISFQLDGESAARDLGNCPSLTYTPDIQKKEHFSSRFGIKTKDLTRITQVGATIKFSMEEVTGENLALFALSDIDTNTAGDTVLYGLSKTNFTGVLSVVGANDIGQQVDFTANVSFVPAGDFSFVTDGDDYSTIDVQAEVLADDDGNYGVWTVRDTAST